MEDFRTRLENEELELKSKIEKLYDFIQSDEFNSIDEFQKPLLHIQLTSMRTYYKCLTVRGAWLDK